MVAGCNTTIEATTRKQNPLGGKTNKKTLETKRIRKANNKVIILIVKKYILGRNKPRKAREEITNQDKYRRMKGACARC